MTFVGWARGCVVGIFFGVIVSGCSPVADTQLDEQKEPHFIKGMNLVNQTDYTGAIEEFEKALEENPRNASARFELGWLYEDKASDPAAAIYNYDRYLKFSATQDKADLVKQHINSCKLELTKTVSAVGAQPSGAQREWDRITIENRDLRSQVTNLQAQLTQAKAAPVVRQYVAAPAPQDTTADPISRRPTVDSPRPDASHPADTHSPTARAGRPVTPLPTLSSRTYSIKSGDTLAAVARKHGVSVDALVAANPRVKPTHLLVGQTLNIPAP